MRVYIFARTVGGSVMQHGDIYVLVLLMLILFGWMYIKLKRHYTEDAEWQVPNGIAAGDLDSEVVVLLEQAGFTLIEGKQKIPIRIHADSDTLESRVFIDGLVEREDELFVVRLARERRPMEWTGSSIRDHLLVIQLLYRSAAGVIYIDPRSGFLHQIRFEMDV
jgi:hypothetical protein